MNKIFGKYVLVEKLAVGGMAEIYLARSTHVDGVEKKLVIKRIHPALSADRNFVSMFIDEARLGVLMTHGNITQVFDFGCVDGYYFLAMEYVDGMDLAAICGRAKTVNKKWSTELAVYIIIEVLEGLDYAHKKRDEKGHPLDLVHRDVSPSNILVSWDGQIKLLDFGIARSKSHEFETRTGVIKGKPGYMSPEQAAGISVDARADVWSTGVTLHELLFNKSFDKCNKSFKDKSLDAILKKSTAVKLDDRYKNANDFLSDLKDYLFENNLKPGAYDVSVFLNKLSQATAPGKNWDMRSKKASEHIAMVFKPDPETDNEDTAETDAPKTLLLDKSNKRRFLHYILTGLTLLIFIILWLLFYNDAQITKPERTVAVSKKLSANVDRSDLSVVKKDKKPADLNKNVPNIKEKLSNTSSTDSKKSDVNLSSHKKRNSQSNLKSKIPPAGGKNMDDISSNDGTSLSVNTIPWTQVELDGKIIGITPILDYKITSGKHIVKIINPVRNLTDEFVFTVKKGEKKKIRKQF